MQSQSSNENKDRNWTELHQKGYLDINFDTESLCLTVSITDVEAEDVLFGLSFTPAVLDVENVVRCQVLHRKRHIRCNDLRAAN